MVIEVLAFCIALLLIATIQSFEAEPPILTDEVIPEPNPFKTKAWLREWRKVRYKALVRDKGMCQCCGRTAQDGVQMEVDHIKPKSKYSLLSLELSNLQCLCSECNRSKSNVDETNWRLSSGQDRDTDRPDSVTSGPY